MMRKASGSLRVSSLSVASPSVGSGLTVSTTCPSTSAASVAFARRGPISSATSIGRTGREYSRTLPSGNLTFSMILSLVWPVVEAAAHLARSVRAAVDASFGKMTAGKSKRAGNRRQDREQVAGQRRLRVRYRACRDVHTRDVTGATALPMPQSIGASRFRARQIGRRPGSCRSAELRRWLQHTQGFPICRRLNGRE